MYHTANTVDLLLVSGLLVCWMASLSISWSCFWKAEEGREGRRRGREGRRGRGGGGRGRGGGGGEEEGREGRRGGEGGGHFVYIKLRITHCANTCTYVHVHCANSLYMYLGICHVEDAKLLAASTSAVEWYKSHAHTSFLSKVIQILIHVRTYVPTQREQDIVRFAQFKLKGYTEHKIWY